MKTVFQIKGMSCASCASAIERAVKKVAGVVGANVNFASEKLFVDYEGELDSKSLVEAVRKTGYEAISNDMNMPMGHDMSTEHDHAKAESDAEIKTLKNKLTFGIFASVIAIILSFGGSYISFIPKNLALLTLLVFATPVEFWVGRQFWRGAYFEFKNLRPGMDSLVVLGTGAAYFFSLIIALANLVPELSLVSLLKFEPYFDVAVVVTVFIILGKYLEARAKGSASEAIKKLLKLQAKTAHLVGADGDTKDIEITAVKIGDVLFIKQGEKIPVDGVIAEGAGSIDESMVTGESLPIDKKAGDKVIGATILKSGSLRMMAVKIGNDTFLAQIIRIVEEAQASKAPIQKLADRITQVFVPIVMTIAIITFITWMLFGPEPWLTYALVNFVAVLVVACPCALGLATPIAVITGTGKGAQNGIIIRNAQSLEFAGRINTVVLDKTGTITKGEPSVTQVIPLSDLKTEEIISIAASLGNNSTHPLSAAVLKEAQSKKISLNKIMDFKEIAGKGIKGKINDKEYFFGNKKLLADENIPINNEALSKSEEYESRGETTLFLSDNKNVLGMIMVADTLKDSARETVAKLEGMGIEVWMLTGDNEKTARAIAEKVGIKNVLASVLPEEKSKKVKDLQEKGKIVAMVGDGVNDAPALTQANIGIAIGTGTDIAIESAGITLSSGDPMGIYKSILLSRNTLKNIKQNLFWAYAYNTALIPVAAGVLYPLSHTLLNPMLAGAAMAFSSLSVVLNSLRLKNIKF
ncbi:MAG: heavy metal translocating P-type ATPase [Candidatus Wolfebacteria bacterium]|nr:heavy metal translocating P-type ATPase [Candidatus Wolfebacteria bacterium]